MYRPQKLKNDLKIKSKSNIRIEGNIVKESCSTLVYYTASSTVETIANMQRGKLLAIECPFTHMFCQKLYKTSVSGFEK